MHARVTMISGDADDLERWRTAVHERAVPAADNASRDAGLVHAVWLLDEDSGRGLSVTLWETREALEAAEEAASANRSHMQPSGTGTLDVLRCRVIAGVEAPRHDK